MKKSILLIAGALGASVSMWAKGAATDSVAIYFDKAMAEMKVSNYYEAYRDLSAALRLNPNDGKVYTALGELSLRLNEAEAAVSASQMALKNLSKKEPLFIATNYFNLATASAMQKDTAQAYEWLDKVQKLKVANATLVASRFRKGLFLSLQNRFKDAYDEMDACVKIDPSDIRGYYGKGAVAIDEEDFQLADASLTKALAINSKLSYIYIQRAHARFKLDKFRDGMDDILNTIYYSGSVDEAVSTMSPFLTDNEKYEFALSCAKLNIARFPESGIWYKFMAETYIVKHDYPSAAEAFIKGAKIDGLDVDYAYRIARTSKQMNDFGHATQYYAYAKKLKPDVNPFLYMTFLSEANRIDEAIACVDSVIAEYPNSSIAYSNKAYYMSLAQRDYKGAIENLQKSIELDSTRSFPLHLLARCYYFSGDKELAKKYCEKELRMMDKDDDDPTPFYNYLFMGDRQKAVEEMDKYMKKHEEDEEKGVIATTYYNAACFYSLFEDKQKALDYFEKSMENGFCSFTHISRDPDLDYIRQFKKFDEIVDRYKKIHLENLKKYERDIFSQGQSFFEKK